MGFSETVVDWTDWVQVQTIIRYVPAARAEPVAARTPELAATVNFKLRRREASAPCSRRNAARFEYTGGVVVVVVAAAGCGCGCCCCCGGNKPSGSAISASSLVLTSLLAATTASITCRSLPGSHACSRPSRSVMAALCECFYGKCALHRERRRATCRWRLRTVLRLLKKARLNQRYDSKAKKIETRENR